MRLAAQGLQLLARGVEVGRLVEQRPLQASVESAPTTMAPGRRVETRSAFISARVVGDLLCRGAFAQKAALDLVLVDARGSIAKSRPALARSWRREGLAEARMSEVQACREAYAGSRRNKPPSSLWVTR